MRRLAAIGVLAAALASDAGAQPFSGGPVPSRAPSSLRALVSTAAGPILVSWARNERYAERRGRSLARRPFITERGGTLFLGREPGHSGSIDRRTYAARPDAFTFADRLAPYTEFLLAQARRGRRTLVATTVRGRPAWRTALPLRANDCAGLPAGAATVWMSRSTLFPLRVVERRGRVTSVTGFRYRSLGARLPASDFATPPLGPDPFVVDHGFRRTSPAAAAANLSYRPELPTVLPPGFVRTVSGWAPLSRQTGAEGSNPRKRELFAAVYRRGFARIDVTQRLAGRRGWLADPFGGECVFQFEERAQVDGVSARYGAGPQTVPHLYWREGRVLFTVSGPLPKADLLAIARSLRRVP
ncbi:MAG: hypothetical protein M3188_08725 [Actinomycetota bacterium]|nr:hypothetical protein [Actinomycetota bacterium]